MTPDPLREASLPWLLARWQEVRAERFGLVDTLPCVEPPEAADELRRTVEHDYRQIRRELAMRRAVVDEASVIGKAGFWGPVRTASARIPPAPMRLGSGRPPGVLGQLSDIGLSSTGSAPPRPPSRPVGGRCPPLDQPQMALSTAADAAAALRGPHQPQMPL